MPAFEPGSSEKDASISVGNINIQGNVDGNIVVGNRNIIGDNNVIYEINTFHGTFVNWHTTPPSITKRAIDLEHPAVRRPRLFVGRKQELDILERYICDKEAVMLYGHSGLGKTTLVKEVAYSNAAKSMPDGVVYLEQPYEGSTPSLQDTLQRIFDRLFESNPPVKLTDSIREAYLSKTSPLLIVDEVGLPQEALKHFPDLFPQGAVIVTGQDESYEETFESIQVNVFSREEAIQLFSEKSGLVVDGETRPLIDQICQILADTPLAITTLATAIRQNRFQLLDGLNVKNTLSAIIAILASIPISSQVNFSTAIERSFKSLYYKNPRIFELELLLDVASATGKSIKREWLETEREGAAKTVKELEDLDVLYANSPRLRLHEGLRQIIQSSIFSSGNRDKWNRSLLERLLAELTGYRTLDFNASLLELLQGLHQEKRYLDFDFIGSELGNLLGILQWAFDQHRWDEVIVLGQALDPYLTLKGLWDEWGKVLNQVLLAARNINNYSVEAWVYHQLGSREIGVGKLQQAIKLLVHALRLRAALGDLTGMAFTYHNLAFVLPPTPSEPEPIQPGPIEPEPVQPGPFPNPLHNIINSVLYHPWQLIFPVGLIGIITILVTLLFSQPVLGLSLEAKPPTYITLGESIEYTYYIKNLGFTRVAGPVFVTDKEGTIICPNINTIDNKDGFLDPNETIKCNRSYKITLTDINNCSVTNNVTVSARNVKSKQASLTIQSNLESCKRTVITEDPKRPPTEVRVVTLTLTISTEPTTYSQVGEIIEYSYTIKNDNMYGLTGDIIVTDNHISQVSCLKFSKRDPNDPITCTASYTVTQADIDNGQIDNIATAKVDYTGSDTVTVPFTIKGPTPNPALSLAKSADPLEYDSVGQMITYTYVVKNEGNVTLLDPTISDDIINNGVPFKCDSGKNELAPGETVICNNAYIITQADFEPKSVTDVATASALYSQKSIISSPVTTTIVCSSPPPGWSAYTINSGDSLYEISTWFANPKITSAMLQTANCMGSSTNIIVGQRIYVPYLTSIGGIVFMDPNSNGLQDPGEQGITGFSVTLRNTRGSINLTTTTNANGQYNFSNLPPGDYFVLQVQETLRSPVTKKRDFGVRPIP